MLCAESPFSESLPSFCIMSTGRPSPHRRIDSLPSFNPQSLYRPHLRPLDLASDFSKSSSRPNHVLLTPPLTPSSSFSSQNTPTTPPDSLPYDASESISSRLLLVGNVPQSASSETLKSCFKPCGSIKGILVRFQSQRGIVVIAFYDSRDANRAQNYVPGITLDGSLLTASLLSSADLRKVAKLMPVQFTITHELYS